MRISNLYSLIFFLILIQAFLVLDLSAESDEHYMYTIERLVQEERYHQAEQLIENHQVSLIQQVAEENDLYEPVMREYLDQCLSILRNEDASHVDKRLAVQQAMILWDAMTTKNAPLWTTWKTELERKMTQLIDRQEISQAEIEEVIYYVEVISPVVKLHLNDKEYQDYEQSIHVLMSNQLSYDTLALEESFSQISKLNIHSMTNANAHYTKWLIFIVFGVIFLSLSYVAWAKYRGEYS